tara:strand:- start:6216 stop:8159 length:1944 start_codon:yes stop_codon:yes gene_type:complete
MNKNLLPTEYQNFIAVSRYAKWLDDEKRRETWDETVSRYMNYISSKVTLSQKDRDELYEGILTLQVVPSMRALMTAGKALERDNTAGYNCCYVPVNNVRVFDETMYILLNGTGVGFSVEYEYVKALPKVPNELLESSINIVVEDSKEGWAKAFREFIENLYEGRIIKYDLSQVRPKGARLKTFGGRASGPEPLASLFEFTKNLFIKNKGKQLSAYNCHCLMCKIGQVVVSGGVRRSAMISLSELDDIEMRDAKSGEFWIDRPYLSLSNNSVVYKTEKEEDLSARPDAETFMSEFTALIRSRAGERGIFNRFSAKKQANKTGRRDHLHEFGCNPCSEVILRPYQFCNLSEVIIRETDNLESLKKKVRLATILGTVQSTLTNFPYLRDIWKKNTEEERLLGVSLTGIMDNTLTNGKNEHLRNILKALKTEAINTNKEYADKLGIPQSTSITCVKPSGTVSQLCDSASGIHARHSKYYIRTIRGDNNDALTKLLIEEGVPHEPCVTQPTTTTIFSFPIKSPDNCVTRNDMSALDQLLMWKIYQEEWCEHKPSCTVSVRDEEWVDVASFVYKYFDDISGISFLPTDDNVYPQAPYQEINEEQYNEAHSKMPKEINWDNLTKYELEDTTAGVQTFACSGDFCEVVDIESQNI